MKKCFIIAIFIFILFGVDTCDRDPVPKLRIFDDSVYVENFKFEKHEYIAFYLEPGYKFSVVHNPECANKSHFSNKIPVEDVKNEEF